MSLDLAITLVSWSVGIGIGLGMLAVMANIIYLMNNNIINKTTAISVISISCLWFSMLIYATTLGAKPPPATAFIEPPTIMATLLGPGMTVVPIALFFIIRLYSKGLRSLCQNLNPRLLIGAQFYRMTGSIFLLETLDLQMPTLIGIPTGIAAFLTGFLGVMLFVFYQPDTAIWRRLVGYWNWLGLGYFSYATLLCILCIAGVIKLTPNPMAIFSYPISFIAAFGVPFSVILHIITQENITAKAKSNSLNQLQTDGDGLTLPA